MKNLNLIRVFFVLVIGCSGYAQTNQVMELLPEGTVLYGNINYNNDTLQKHLLDIYLPKNDEEKKPLVVFIHGGAWFKNDKYADMSYMKNTLSEIINEGFAIASIDYRFTTQATFPSQIQDCYKAVSFLFENAEKYNLDTNHVAVMGFSAGGHLASLMGLADNNEVREFYFSGNPKSFNFDAVLDFYGPMDLTFFASADDESSPESMLLGAPPLERPDLATKASPLTYLDEKDPPFLIIQGEKDESVDPKHSKLLSAWLNVYDIENELIIVPDAPHYGEMFDAPAVRERVLYFLKTHLE